MRFLLFLWFLLCLACLTGQAQVKQSKDPSRDPVFRDGYIRLPVRLNCKGHAVSWLPITERYSMPKTLAGKRGPAKKSNFVIHGNILYDLNYWSDIDTPYAQRNVYQHMLQSYLDIDYKHSYPFRVYFTTRWSNSPLFRNTTDVNVAYNAGDFRNRVRRQVADLIERRGQDSLNKMEKELTLQEREYNALKTWLNGPDLWQKLMAERERLWFKSQDSLRRAQAGHSGQDTTGGQGAAGGGPLPVNGAGSLPNLDQLGKYKFGGSGLPGSSDTGKTKTGSDTAYTRQYDSLQKRLDSMGTKLAALRQAYQEAKALQGGSNADAQKQIDGVNGGNELKAKLDSMHIADSSLPKGYRTMYSVRSFGIGRAMVDYSELSVKNLSINGVEVEYNPSAYMAVAAGTVDYRYQDYTLENKAQGQYVAVVRYGWGKKDGNNVILTYYTGRRQLYTADTTIAGAPIPSYNLMGFTIAGRYRLGRTSALIAEVAKSSTPYYSLDSSEPHHELGSVLKFGNRSNEAYSLKYTSLFPRTQTSVNATWSRYGADFQSFSLYTSGSQQSAWSVRVDQPLFQHHLQVTAAVKTNDYVNPLISTSFKTTAVFETFQATWRKTGWPTLSVGYFPSSQIVKLNNDQYQENLFYTLTASATESYKFHSFSMLSLLLYTRFYNKDTDTGFVYYNTRNLLFSQSAFIGRLTLQLQASATLSTEYNLYVLDDRADYRLTRWLSLGAGLKYNIQTVYNIRQWGYSGTATARVPKVGDFRLSVDKGFIPGNDKQLVPNTLGRLTYIKVF